MDPSWPPYRRVRYGKCESIFWCESGIISTLWERLKKDVWNYEDTATIINTVLLLLFLLLFRGYTCSDFWFTFIIHVHGTPVSGLDFYQISVTFMTLCTSVHGIMIGTIRFTRMSGNINQIVLLLLLVAVILSHLWFKTALDVGWWVCKITI